MYGYVDVSDDKTFRQMFIYKIFILLYVSDCYFQFLSYVPDLKSKMK